MDPIHVVSRWAHVAAIVVMVGGAFFMRMVLLPVAATLADDPHRQLRTGVMKRWSIVLRCCMTLILVSGLYNYLVVTRPMHAGPEGGRYHMLIGLKVCLALAIFGIAEALVKKDPRKWLTINLVLAATVIAISAILKFTPITHGQ